MRERGSMRACRREFSERIAGLEARLGVATNEHESSLDAGGRVALRGHLSGPARPFGGSDGPLGHGRLHPKRLASEKYKSRDSSQDLYFLRNPEPLRFPPNSPQFFPILFGNHQQMVCI